MAKGTKLTNAFVATLAPGDTTTVPHGIRSDFLPRIPNKVLPDRGTPIRILSVDNRFVTLFNPASTIETAVFYATLEFSTQRDPTDTDVSYWQGLSISGLALDRAETLTVAKAGGQYTSVAAAIAVANALADANTPYMVDVFPGDYDEPPFALASYVCVSGHGGSTVTHLRTTDENAHFVTGAPNSEIKGITLHGPSGVGFAAVDYTGVGETDLFHVRHLTISTKSYYGIWCHPAATGAIQAADVDIENEGAFVMAQFIRVTGQGIFTGHYLTALADDGLVNTGWYTSGVGARLFLDSSLFGVTNSVDGVFADDGAFVRITALTFRYGTTALHIGSTGTTTEVYMIGCTTREFITTWDVLIDTPLCRLIYVGCAAHRNKLSIPPGTSVAMQFTDDTLGDGNTTVIGELYLGALGEEIPLHAYTHAIAETGGLVDGTVTVGVGLNVHVTADSGFIALPNVVKKIDWVTQDIAVAANTTAGWIIVDQFGGVQPVYSVPDYVTVIVLASFATDATDVVLLSTHTPMLGQETGDAHVYARDVVGPIQVSGGAVTKNAPVSLKLDIDTCTFYIYNHRKTSGALSPVTFVYWYTVAGVWTKVSGSTDIDPTQYNNTATGLAAVPAGLWKRDLVFVTSNDGGTEVHIVYGQETFASQLLAVNNPVPPDVLQTAALRVAAVIIQEGTVDIAEVVDERPRLGQLATGSTAVTVHALLSGLAADDHPQYQLRSEQGIAGGYPDLDGGALVPATQLPLTATPPANVTKAAAAVGGSSELARADHKHDVTTAAPVVVGTANAEGGAVSLARSDHVHDHGAQTSGTLHALAIAGGTAGFESGADKLKLDGIASGAAALTAAPPANVTKAAAQVGAAGDAARADHKHDITTAAASTIGTANTEGAASSLARSDHGHSHGAQTDGTHHAVAVAGGANGFESGADKLKLDGIAAGATNTPLTASAPANVTKAAAQVGAATDAARADHKHDVTTAAPSTIGTANAEGAATSLARSDHVHQSRQELRQTAFAEQTVDVTTASLVFVDLLTVSLTTLAGATLLIHAAASGDNTNDNMITSLRVTVDGVQKAAAGIRPNNNFPGTGAIVVRVTGLTAALHTVKLQWHTSNNTARIRPVTLPDTNYASLLVQEVSV